MCNLILNKSLILQEEKHRCVYSNCLYFYDSILKTARKSRFIFYLLNQLFEPIVSIVGSRRRNAVMVSRFFVASMYITVTLIFGPCQSEIFYGIMMRLLMRIEKFGRST
jgi:hypothetical protein